MEGDPRCGSARCPGVSEAARCAGGAAERHTQTTVSCPTVHRTRPGCRLPMRATPMQRLGEEHQVAARSERSSAGHWAVIVAESSSPTIECIPIFVPAPTVDRARCACRRPAPQPVDGRSSLIEWQLWRPASRAPRTTHCRTLSGSAQGHIGLDRLGVCQGTLTVWVTVTELMCEWISTSTVTGTTTRSSSSKA